VNRVCKACPHAESDHAALTRVCLLCDCVHFDTMGEDTGNMTESNSNACQCDCHDTVGFHHCFGPPCCEHEGLVRANLEAQPIKMPGHITIQHRTKGGRGVVGRVKR
jgi:hypothetical protein